jgi:hypothetical protein
MSDITRNIKNKEKLLKNAKILICIIIIDAAVLWIEKSTLKLSITDKSNQIYLNNIIFNHNKLFFLLCVESESLY